MQAIITKYHGPSNVKGSRVSATCQAGRVMIEWSDALNSANNHRSAAMALCLKLNWDGEWLSGVLPTGETVWVCTTDRNISSEHFIARKTAA